jgi:hypothetical protein
MQDCVGDSLGKHNYNALALDTTVCNLLDLLFNNDNSVNNVINDLANTMVAYNPIRDNITVEKKNNIIIASTTVNVLSSFWSNYQFSIEMPINSISLNDTDLVLLNPTLSSVTAGNLENTVNYKIKPLVDLELNTNYVATKYPDNTVINVSCMLYDIVPLIADPNIFDPSLRVDPLIKKSFSPTEVFSRNNREITADYSRDSVYFSTGVILRYFVMDNKWNYMGHILDGSRSTALPNRNIPAIVESPLSISQTKTSDKNYISNCEPLLPDTWYSAEQYIYASALYTGSPNNLGTITLTFRTIDSKTKTFSYTAGGYNATTTSGTDIYLEFDGSVINAYVQYPSPKTLVQSWIYPYKGQIGVNFKFTYDGNGVSFNMCGSTQII